ncbi:CopD family protein [Marinicella litoralis]|uniref:Protoporphyrinogen IX oxidase n=1 Tax=Marinicella litoralis TaxID=644220 RepID=A0A4R6XXT4_9GAMM|nr:CopD family protein [Marinicella litoralis]TDR23429.1 putative membrane protein [Marinicella litoralis]
MLWIKTFHVFFVVSWFACLFYLPRLYVNHAQTKEDAQRVMLLGMEIRLIKMMRFTFWGTVVSATLLVYSIAGSGWKAYIQQGWFMAKIALVFLLVFYHFWCIKIHYNFAQNQEHRGHVWFRVFNEVPALMLLLVLYLVIAKPF